MSHREEPGAVAKITQNMRRAALSMNDPRIRLRRMPFSLAVISWPGTRHGRLLGDADGHSFPTRT
jgi:hypothetical protein